MELKTGNGRKEGENLCSETLLAVLLLLVHLISLLNSCFDGSCLAFGSFGISRPSLNENMLPFKITLRLEPVRLKKMQPRTSLYTVNIFLYCLEMFMKL